MNDVVLSTEYIQSMNGLNGEITTFVAANIIMANRVAKDGKIVHIVRRNGVSTPNIENDEGGWNGQ